MTGSVLLMKSGQVILVAEKREVMVAEWEIVLNDSLGDAWHPSDGLKDLPSFNVPDEYITVDMTRVDAIGDHTPPKE